MFKTPTGQAVQGGTDPVCGIPVDSRAASLQASFNGQTYFFCAPACKEAFESDPPKYLQQKPRRKGIWGRYLERLTKATGGKPPSCCG